MGGLVVVVLTTACSPPQGGLPEGAAVAEEVKPGATLMGNYLAGRHAQVQRDISTAANFLKSALDMDPGNADLLRRTFVLMAVEGRMDEALALAGRVVAARPGDPIANLTLVSGDILAGRYERAEERLGALPKNGINGFMSPLLGAWARVGRGAWDGAQEALKPLEKNEGFKTLYYLHSALVNEAAGRVEAAGEGFRQAAKVQNGLSLRLVELFGAYQERNGQADEARALYQRYLSRRQGSRLLAPSLERLKRGEKPAVEVSTATFGAAEAFFDVASSLRQQNASETGLVFGRLALWLRPDFPVAQVLVAGILEADNRLESANGVYAGINRLSPFSWAARLRIAANLDRLDRSDEAVKTLRAMAVEDKDEADPLIDLGDILRGRDRFEEAVEAYDQAVARIDELGKRHWSLLYARGIALERSKKWSRAEADFLRALEFEPDQPYVLNYLGYSWVEKGINLEKAEAMIRKAVELRPNDGYIVDSLGWVLYQLGKPDEAVRELERAVELRAEDPVINDHLGDAYWRVGRRAEARFQWSRALSLDPDPDLIEAIQAKLNKGMVKTANSSPNASPSPSPGASTSE